MIDNFPGNVHLQTKLREIVEKAVCVALCGFKSGAFLKRDTSSSKWFLQLPFCVFTTVFESQTLFPKKSLKNGHFSWVLNAFCKYFIQNSLICLRTKQYMYWIKKNPVQMAATFQICLLRKKTYIKPSLTWRFWKPNERSCYVTG